MNNFWKGKKVLVTGASGFIGSNAVDLLIKLDARVTAVVSSHTPIKKIKQNLALSLDKITLKKADILDLNQCLKITKGQNIVLNFAAMDGGYTFKISHCAQILRVNSQITLNMLEASKQNSVDRLLIMSSVDVYSSECTSPIKESCSLINDQKYIDGYQWSKRFSEILAKTYFQEYKLKITIARCGNVYGPRDNVEKNRIIPTFINESLKGNNIYVWGDSSEKRSFLYITDLLKALLDLVEKYPTCDPVNIASENPISNKNLGELVINLIGNKNKIIKKNKQHKGFVNKIIDVQKAKKIIDFHENTSLEDGLLKTANYLKLMQN